MAYLFHLCIIVFVNFCVLQILPFLVQMYLCSCNNRSEVCGFHHAIMVVSQMRAELSNQQAEILAVMQSMVTPNESPAR